LELTHLFPSHSYELFLGRPPYSDVMLQPLVLINMISKGRLTLKFDFSEEPANKQPTYPSVCFEADSPLVRRSRPYQVTDSITVAHSTCISQLE